MRTLAVSLAVLVAAGLAAPAGQPDPPKDAEKLPEFPKLDPKNAVTDLTKDGAIVAEVAAAGDKKKVVRVGVKAEVCLREGALEVFMCKKGTKEHEAVVRVDVDAKMIHLAILAAGVEQGTPTQFVDPTTQQAKWKAATGGKVNVLVHYTRGGKAFTHPAQEWVWDRTKKAPMAHGWVFAGSVEIKDPDIGGRVFYGANSGDVISISNFPYSTLEIPVEISKDDAQLTYEARTDKIPPLASKVWVILEPAAGKK
ncbi:MAG: hypothetical protein C0501_06005 [Isosphaera sp.]|nr:hypothetical protein [Isosphaera sp.]